jgi:hypothetical protein
MRPIALLANGAMLAATPINGGHYFIDVAAGVAVAVVAIVLACRLGREPAAAAVAGEENRARVLDGAAVV